MKLERVVKTVLGGDWKTTIGGFAVAIATAVLPLFETGEWPSAERLEVAIVVAIIGRFARMTVGLDKVKPCVVVLGAIAMMAAAACTPVKAIRGGELSPAECVELRAYIELADSEAVNNAIPSEARIWWALAADGARIALAGKCAASEASKAVPGK